MTKNYRLPVPAVLYPPDTNGSPSRDLLSAYVYQRKRWAEIPEGITSKCLDVKTEHKLRLDYLKGQIDAIRYKWEVLDHPPVRNYEALKRLRGIGVARVSWTEARKVSAKLALEHGIVLPSVQYKGETSPVAIFVEEVLRDVINRKARTVGLLTTEGIEVEVVATFTDLGVGGLQVEYPADYQNPGAKVKQEFVPHPAMYKKSELRYFLRENINNSLIDACKRKAATCWERPASLTQTGEPSDAET